MASTYELIVQATDKTTGPLRKVTASVEKVESTAKKATRALANMAGSSVRTSLSALSSGLKSAAAAATVAATGFIYLTKKNLDALDSIEKVSTKLGIGAEFLTTWGKVAEEAGLSTEQFNTGLQRFARRLGEAQTGTGTLYKSMNEMGVAIYNADGTTRKTTDVFKDFIQALGDTENKNRQLVHAMAAFDTEGVQFVNVANMGAEAIAGIAKHAKDAGIAVDDGLVKKAAEANDALSKLFDYAKGFQLQFFGSLAEPIEQAAEAIRKGIQVKIDAAGGMTAFANDLSASFLKMIAEFTIAGARLADDIRVAFNDGANALKKVFVGLNQVFGAVGIDLNIRMGDRNERISELKQQIVDLKSAMDGLRDQTTLQELMGLDSVFGKLGINVSDSTVAFDEMGKKLFAAKVELQNIENGTITYMNTTQVASDTAVKAVSGTVTALYEQAWQLGENAEQARKTAEATNRFAAEDFLMSQTVVGGNAALNTRNEKLEEGAKFINNYAAEEKLMAQALEATKSSLVTYEDKLHSYTMAAINKTREDSYAITIYGELLSLYDRGIISLAALTDAEQKLGLAKKETNNETVKQLTFMQQLINAEATNIKNRTDIQRALSGENKQVQELAKQYGVSEKVVREALQKQLSTMVEVVDKSTELQDTVLTNAQIIRDGIKTAGDSLATDLATAMRKGENILDTFENAFNRMLDNILQAIIEKNITQPLIDQLIGAGDQAGSGGFLGQIMGMFGGGSGGGGFLSGIGDSIMGFFGARAGGGPVAGNRPYLVGERGPELFTPNTAGNIIPNDELNSGGGSANVTFNINAIDTQDAVQVLVENRETITAIVSDALNKRGKTGIVS